ncbi:STE-domain-containing protein [Sanghuangporus baumii]|uniref:STE-domain-containing protein n=1 Tax=Sanghuangporus baumii TaxID=108892 RepID=A0A9Q5HU13_SANBA|nr:STE-domain-containing protein [Sanghuangporus baumii]
MMDAYDPRTHPPPHVQYDQHSYASSYYTPGLQSSASASSSAYPSPAYPSYDYASQSPYSGSNSGFNSVESRTLGYNLPAQSTESSLAGSFAAGEGGHSAASSVRSSPDVGPSLDYPSNSASALANQSRPPMHSQSHSPNVSASSSASSSPRPSQPLKNNSLSNGSPSQVTFNGTPLSRPLTHKEQEMLAHLDRLKFFLATAPSRWATADGDGVNESDGSFGNSTMSAGRMQQGTPMMPHPNTHPALNRFLLPSGKDLFHRQIHFFPRCDFCPLAFTFSSHLNTRPSEKFCCWHFIIIGHWARTRYPRVYVRLARRLYQLMSIDAN